MIYKLFGLSLIVALLTVTSCLDNGDDFPQIVCDCAPMGFWQFDLITSDDSRNSLVFGPNAPYSAEDIRLYNSIDSSEFILEHTEPALIEGAFFYTILTDIPETIRIEADSAVSYEITVEYTSLDLECCPGAITQMKFRDSLYMHDDGIFRLIFD